MKLVKPKKFLGQHFLKDLKVAQDIADTVDACPGLPILEVGPGMGVLTQFLVRKERPVKVVELDYESVAYLREEYPSLEDNIIEDDFLKMNLHRLFDGKPFVLTGNYPYNISSQIFFKMLDNKDIIPCCTGMIQKEVAERIAAGPGSKTYGILSVLIQAWYKVEYLFTVSEHVFNPPPKVKSAVIRMTRNDTQELGCDEKLFKQVVKTTFNQRRKTLRNSIKPILGKECPLTEDTLFNKRPEQLSVEEFIDLTNKVEMKNYYDSVDSSFEYIHGKLLHQKDKKFIEDVLDIIKENISNSELGPELIANQMKTSTRNLYRQMKKIIEISPTELVKDYKLSYAAKLLITTNLSVKEIIYKIGITNKSYFYNEFFKKYQLSPKQYKGMKAESEE